MLKLTTTSYLHLFNTLNFNIFVPKSRSNTRGIQLVYSTATPVHVSMLVASSTLSGPQATAVFATSMWAAHAHATRSGQDQCCNQTKSFLPL